MHVLTKIFIVLVSLLTVLLVPLVVVYSYNENSFQSRYLSAEAQAASLRSALEAAKAGFGAAEMRKDGQIQELEARSLDLRRQADQLQAENRKLDSDVKSATRTDAEIHRQLATLTSSVDAGQQLTESLIEELRGLRREALASERQKVELDEHLRDTRAKLDAAIEARRALQEELQRLRDEHAKTLDTVYQYVARHGELERGPAAGQFRPSVPIDKNLDARILSVRRSSDQTLAEINAGSRDGVKDGWVMTIGANGQFMGKLRIIEVDINRSTGVVELEQGAIAPGMDVYARVAGGF